MRVNSLSMWALPKGMACSAQLSVRSTVRGTATEIEA